MFARIAPWLVLGTYFLTGCHSAPRASSLPGFGWLGGRSDTPVLDVSSDYPPPSAIAQPQSIPGDPQYAVQGASNPTSEPSIATADVSLPSQPSAYTAGAGSYPSTGKPSLAATRPPDATTPSPPMSTQIAANPYVQSGPYPSTASPSPLRPTPPTTPVGPPPGSDRYPTTQLASATSTNTSPPDQANFRSTSPASLATYNEPLSTSANAYASAWNGSGATAPSVAHASLSNSNNEMHGSLPNRAATGNAVPPGNGPFPLAENATAPNSCANGTCDASKCGNGQCSPGASAFVYEGEPSLLSQAASGLANRRSMESVATRSNPSSANTGSVYETSGAPGPWRPGSTSSL